MNPDETVTAFISQFSRLLSSIAAGDDREIWLLPTVNDAEQALSLIHI